MSTKHYSLVKFLEEDDDDVIEVIPTKWLVGKDKAYWPSKKELRDKITRWVISLRDPDSNWKQYLIVVKYQYTTYNNARKALVKAEDETNIDSNVSDCEKPRKRKKPIRFQSDDSDDVPQKRDKISTMAVSDSEDDHENTKSILRDKVQSILKNVSSRKRKPFSEQNLNRVVEEQNKNDNTILKQINSDNNRTKRIVVKNITEGNVSRKNYSQHLAENKKDQGDIQDIRENIYDNKNTDVDSDNNEKLALTKSASVLPSRGFTHNKELALTKSASVLPSRGFICNEELALTSSAFVLPEKRRERKFTLSPELSNKPDDNFDTQNSHFLTIDDASPVEHNRYSPQSPLLSSPSSPSLLSLPSKIKLLAKNSKNASALENSSLKGHAKAKSTSNNSSSSKKAVVTSKSSAVQLVKVELLQEMSSKIDILLINQERILRELFPGEQAVIRPKNLPPLPLRTHEAFNNFEKFLQNDINFNATVDYFASLSRTSTEKSAVGKLLPKIISNTLARILNWTGSGSIKLGIEGSTLHEALQCAILKNFPKSDLQTATSTMKRWFHTSNQRKVD